MSSATLLALLKGFEWIGKALVWAARIFILATFINLIPFTFMLSSEIIDVLTSTFVIDLLKSLCFFFPIKFILGCCGACLTFKYYHIIFHLFIKIYQLIFVTD